MKRYRIFPDINTVSNTQRIALKASGLLNPDGSVPSWNKLAPAITNRSVTPTQCKELILLELDRDEPRVNLLNRLVCYFVGIDKRKIAGAIDKELSKRK